MPGNPLQPEKIPPEKKQRLKAELEEIATTYEGIEQARFTRDILLELQQQDSPLYNDGRPAEEKWMDEDGSLKRFLLPGTSDLSVTESKEETYEKRDWENKFWETDSHRVCWVNQGNMIEMPRDHLPYTLASMSECSFLVGIKDNKMISAHISYSFREQFDSALDHFEMHDISPKDTYVIANVRSDESHKNTKLGTGTPLNSRSDYDRYNIPDENIRSFTYENKKVESGRKRENLQLVIASPEFIFSSGFDEFTNKKEQTYDFDKERELFIQI